MANILGTQTLDNAVIILVDANPSAGAGTPAELGSIATVNDGSGLYLKTGVTDVDWSNVLDPPIITGDVELDFGNIPGGDGNATLTIANLLITNANLKSFSYIEKSNINHDLDDFVAEGVSFSIQNIQDNVSFDIVASVKNNTWGKYKITYKITI